MKRFLLTGCLFVLIAPWVWGDARNADVPVLTTLLEQRDGSKVKLSYRALHWEADTLDSIQSTEEVRTYYNTYILCKLGILDTNIKLKFGPRLLVEPGVYYLGFRMNTDKTWTFLISDDQAIKIQLPLTITTEPKEIPFLSFVFTPGITDRDFLLNVQSGNQSTSVRITMIGIPSRTLEPTPADSPQAASLPIQAATPTVSLSSMNGFDLPMTDTINIPSPDKVGSTSGHLFVPDEVLDILRASQALQKNSSTPPRAGSGSLRYLYELKKESEEKSTKEKQDGS